MHGIRNNDPPHERPRQDWREMMKPIRKPTWREIFGFSSEGGHPGMQNVRQAYLWRATEPGYLGSRENYMAMLDAALKEAEVDFRPPHSDAEIIEGREG